MGVTLACLCLPLPAVAKGLLAFALQGAFGETPNVAPEGGRAPHSRLQRRDARGRRSARACGGLIRPTVYVKERSVRNAVRGYTRLRQGFDEASVRGILAERLQRS